MNSVEFGSERIPRSLLWGKRANDERHCSLRIEASPQLAAEKLRLYCIGMEQLCQSLVIKLWYINEELEKAHKKK